jgi:hypothetical protein
VPVDATRASGVDPFDVDLRVLHVVHPAASEAARYARDVADGEAHRGWDVHVFGLPRSGPPVTAHPWPGPRRGTRRAIRELRAVVADARPDVVVLHGGTAGFVGRLVVRGRVPTAYVPHGWSFRRTAMPTRPFAVTWERLASRWTNVVVAVSPVDAEAALRARIWIPVFAVCDTAAHPVDDAVEQLAAVAVRAYAFGRPARTTILSMREAAVTAAAAGG